MDPVGIAASTATLFQTGGFIFKCGKNLKNATREQESFRIELNNFLMLLQTLKGRLLKSQSDSQWFKQVKQLYTRDGLISQMEQILSSLALKLRYHNKLRLRLKAKLLWNLERDDIQAAIMALARLNSVISSALQDDHFDLSLAIKADTSRAIESLTELQLEAQRQAHQNAVEWLKPSDWSQSYHLALQKRLPGSGRWFLENASVVDWMASPSCFWLYGKPGCGKTVLSSIVIEKLLVSCGDSDGHEVAHFFFESGDMTKRSAGDFLRSILVQFGHQGDTRLQIIQQLYQKHSSDFSRPSNMELVSALREIISTKQKAYLVIDGLEESPELKAVLKIIRELSHHHRDNLHLLVTSRLDKTIKDDFDDGFLKKLEMTTDLVSSDIQHFVEHTLETEKQFLKWNDQIRKEMLTMLTSKSDGMFQWVFCQLEELQHCIREKDLRTTLATLPETLNETYERVLARIDQNGHRDDAIRILQWLCYAERPMQRRELVDCLAIEIKSQPHFSPAQRIPDPDDILKLCSSLISMSHLSRQPKHDEDTEDADKATRQDKEPVIRLSHFSVLEYLVSDRCRFQSALQKEPASAVLTQSCVLYLLHMCELESITTENLYGYPLAHYAAAFWFEHMNDLNWRKPREDILDSAVQLLKGHPKGLETWRRIFDIDSQLDEHMTLLWYVSVIVRLQAGNLQSDYDGIIAPIDLVRRQPGSPFYYACLTGNIALVKRLLSSDVDLNVSHGGRLHYPLAAAISSGKAVLTKFLSSNGADEAAIPTRYRYMAIASYVMRTLAQGFDVTVTAARTSKRK